MTEVDRMVEDVEAQVAASPEHAVDIYATASDAMIAQADLMGSSPAAAVLRDRAAHLLWQAHRRASATANDFDVQEKQQAQAHQEVGHLDDLEVRARRDEIEEDRRGGGPAQNVSIAPESVTEKTPLGRQVTLRWSPTSADNTNRIVQQDTVVMWTGRKREAQACSLEIDTFFPDGTVPGQVNRPYALIQLGTDGVTSPQIKVDAGNGVRCNLSASSVNVLVGMARPPGTPSTYSAGAVTAPGVVVVPGTYIGWAVTRVFDSTRGVDCTSDYASTITGTVGGTGFLAQLSNNVAQLSDEIVISLEPTSSVISVAGRLGFFASSSVAPVTCTSYIDNLAAGAVSERIYRPVRAQSILQPQMSLEGGSLQLKFYDSGDHLIYIQNVAFNANIPPIPWTGDAVYCTLKNTGGSTTSFRLPNLLSL